MTRTKRLYKGQWSGLSATTIAELAGCSPSHAKRLLADRQSALKRDLTLADVGQLIYEFRHGFQDKSLDSYLNRWTGPGS